MVNRGTEPSSVSGLSAPIVLVTLSPFGVHTSHAQPEPKAVSPALMNSARNLSKLPKSLSIMEASFPVGLPPPFGCNFLHNFKIENREVSDMHSNCCFSMID